MLRSRVVPVLLVEQGRLVKTRQFKSPTYVGDPINAIRIFNEKEVDEIAVLDIRGDRSETGPNFSLVESVAAECFMPLSYGGRIRSVNDARRLFDLGVEKVIVRTSAAQHVDVVSEIAQVGGSQSVTVSVDLLRGRSGKLRLHAPKTGRHKDGSWTSFLVDAEKAGAGEVLLQAVSQDGCMSGMDTAMISEASALLNIPLLAAGGVGSTEDIVQGLRAGASAVGVGAYFVFQGPRRAVLITYPAQEQLAAIQESSE